MGEPIRIAQVVGPVVLGGVDTMVMNYYRHIDRSKVQFDFIMDGYEKTPIDDEIRALGGRVYKVEPYAKNIVKSMRQYYRIFRENRYPIVHCHMNTLSVFPLFEAWRAGVPVRIAHSHSTAVKSEGTRTTIKYMLRPFSKLFPTDYCACAEYAGRWLFGDKFFDSGKVRVIKNAIDLERFSFKPQVRTQMREKLGIENKFVVGHVGRFMYQKNHDFLIDIFDEIHKQNPNSILLLIGDGPLKKQIQEKVDKLGLTNSVQFLGLRRDVPDLLQAMDVFVLPSYYEGLPVVAVEAQTAGLPMIVSGSISKEVQITSLLTFCSLEESAEKWASLALSAFTNNPRLNMINSIKRSGFEICNAARELSEWYLSKVC